MKKMYNTGTVNHAVQDGGMCSSLVLGKGLEPDIKKYKKQGEEQMENIKLTNAKKGLGMAIKCIGDEAVKCFRGIIQAKECIENVTESLIRRCGESASAAEETDVALGLLCTCMEYVKEDITDAENSRSAAEGYSIHDMLADDNIMEDAMFEYERYIMLLESCGSELSRIIKDMGIICHIWDLPMECQEAAQKFIVEANNIWNSAYGRYEELGTAYSEYEKLHDKEVYFHIADDAGKTKEVCGYWEWGKECEHGFMADWMQCMGLLVQKDKERNNSGV